MNKWKVENNLKWWTSLFAIEEHEARVEWKGGGLLWEIIEVN
jgi:hypothetical protein